MIDIMTDGDLEDGSGWSFVNLAGRDGLAARGGSFGGYVTRRISPAAAGIAISPVTTKAMVVGDLYRFRGWFKWAYGGDTQELTVQIFSSVAGSIYLFYLNKDAGTITQVLPSFPFELVTSGYDFTDWVQLDHTFAATDLGTIYVDVRNRIKNPKVTATWYFDDFSIETDDMAVKLSERGVSAIQTLLASDLETELTAIDTDRSDTITTAGTVTAYYKYPRAVISGGQTHIEVFEESFEFEHPYSDADASRATYRLPVVVRITFFNRDQDSQENFTTRARRLAAGVFNVFNKKPTLAGADAAVQIVASTVVDPQWITDGDESQEITKALITIRLELMCEEVQ